METITMWADMSSSAATNAHRNAPDTHVRNAILSTEDATKIRKDAELAIEKDKKIREMRVFRSKSGEVYGFVKDGRIYLDPRIASAETAVHEYGHLWAEALRKANPEAWKRLTDDLLSHEDVVEQVKKLYPELEGDELAEEVFTHFAGRRGAERLRAERNKAIKEEHTVMGKARIAVAFERLREALQRFWEAARDLFAGRNEKLSEYTAEDFADMMMADLMNGWKPGPGEGGRKKTTSGERSGADSGNSSSEGLLSGSSEHLSRNALAPRKDAANLRRNTESIKRNIQKIANEGFKNSLGSAGQCVRALGKELGLGIK
ncbi:MAG: hypothetical protein IKR18_10845 [Bacteroidaceae bacterium]|nr:hypothetical protein [Bacteroidaceae bacterium]